MLPVLGKGQSVTYMCITRRRMSTSRSTPMSSKVWARNRFLRSVFRQPATGQLEGPDENMRSTQDSHILW